MNNVYNNEKDFLINNDQPVLYNSGLNKNKSHSLSTSHTLHNKVTSSKRISTNTNNNEKDILSVNDNSSTDISSNIKVDDENDKRFSENYHNNKNSYVFIPKSACDSGFLTDVIIHDKEKQRKKMELFKQNSSNGFSSYLQNKYGKSKSDLNNDFLLEHEDEIFNNNKDQSANTSEEIPNIDAQNDISTTEFIISGKID